MPDPATLYDRGAGCLLGGALGDALGAPVEFLPLRDIREEYGPDGITTPPRPALITDDTQLTLFTAEGYLHAWVRGKARGSWGPAEAVWLSYQRWLTTQQVDGPEPGDVGLLAEPRLYAGRSPGLTCLRALQAPAPPTREVPVNDSAGCDALVRAAPAGFAATAEIAYQLGCEFAALTHGSPSGWAPAGALALIVHLTAVRGRKLPEAIDQAIGRVLRDDVTTSHAMATAVNAAVADLEALGRSREARIFGRDPDEGGPSAWTIEQLGKGWTGPEALAIAVYAAVVGAKPDRFADALRLAVNHSGDSDSTAAVTGSILGAVHGVGVLPRPWLSRLELLDVIAETGQDLAAACLGEPFDEARYTLPGL